MVVNRKVTGTAVSVPKGLVLGGLISLGVTILGSALIAWLLNKEVMAQNKTGYGIMMMILLASFLGAQTASGTIKHRRMLYSLLSGVLYYLVLLSITALFFGGQYEAVGVTALLVFGGSGCSGLMALRSDGGGKRGKRRIASRTLKR